jgi:large subunit ribosomal protein L24
MKIKKGDTIIVTAGKDKGKEGVIARSFPKRMEVLVDGINIVKRHKKATRRGSQGQIVAKPMPISVSNVALKDAKTGKPVRVGYKVEGEGDKAKKVRVARPSGVKI